MNSRQRRAMVRHNPKTVTGRPRKIGVEPGFGPRHPANAKEGDEAGPDLTAIPTDTVAAMLTPREAVLNRNAAELAGRGKIEALNEEGNQLAKKGVDLAARGQSIVPGVPMVGRPVASGNVMKYVQEGALRREEKAQLPKLAAGGESDVGVSGVLKARGGEGLTPQEAAAVAALLKGGMGSGQNLTEGPTDVRKFVRVPQEEAPVELPNPNREQRGTSDMKMKPKSFNSKTKPAGKLPYSTSGGGIPQFGRLPAPPPQQSGSPYVQGFEKAQGFQGGGNVRRRGGMPGALPAQRANPGTGLVAPYPDAPEWSSPGLPTGAGKSAGWDAGVRGEPGRLANPGALPAQLANPAGGAMPFGLPPAINSGIPGAKPAGSGVGGGMPGAYGAPSGVGGGMPGAYGLPAPVGGGLPGAYGPPVGGGMPGAYGPPQTGTGGTPVAPVGGGGFYPPGQGFNKFAKFDNYASGTPEVPPQIGAPNPQQAYGPPVNLSAPDITRMLQAEGRKQGLTEGQIASLAKAFSSFGGGGGGVDAGAGGNYAFSFGDSPGPGYQGGISDIGYPPFLMPNAEYHGDKGSTWTGPYDPQYLVQRYQFGTSWA